MLDHHAREVNRLTERWVAVCTGDSTVVSGAGAWPLLALLADAADGRGRAELEAAIGVPADQAADAARAIVDLLSSCAGMTCALALWTRADLPVRPDWLRRLPPRTHELLAEDPAASQRRMDAWAAKSTDGMIERMPVTVDTATLLVLASAIAAQASWIEPFTDGVFEGSRNGPWQGRPLAALTRTTTGLDAVRLMHTPAGPLTCLVVTSDGGFDVHLFLGEQNRLASEVLAAAVRAQSGAYEVVPGDVLSPGTPGPGLSVEQVPSFDGIDRLAARLPRFSVTGSHDLLALPKVFGLDTITDASRGHLPGISPEPLAVQQAKQDAVATFTATGFRAAAITAMAALAGAAPLTPATTARRISVTFDRPFGFLVVHRRSGLVLFAGWVADAEAWDPDTHW